MKTSAETLAHMKTLCCFLDGEPFYDEDTGRKWFDVVLAKALPDLLADLDHLAELEERVKKLEAEVKEQDEHVNLLEDDATELEGLFSEVFKERDTLRVRVAELEEENKITYERLRVTQELVEEQNFQIRGEVVWDTDDERVELTYRAEKKEKPK